MSRRYYLANRERLMRRQREYRLLHANELREARKQKRLLKGEEIRERQREFYKNCTDEQRRKYARTIWKNQARLRLKALNGYGRKCVQCGFTDMRALQFDHVHGRRGAKRINGPSLYRWLIKNNFPPEFQVLCANCNVIKKLEKGECKRKWIIRGL